jgi:hypothetical protein
MWRNRITLVSLYKFMPNMPAFWKMPENGAA